MAKSEGKPKRKNKIPDHMKAVAFRMPRVLHERVKASAVDNYRSIGAEVNYLCETGLAAYAAAEASDE